MWTVFTASTALLYHTGQKNATRYSCHMFLNTTVNLMNSPVCLPSNRSNANDAQKKHRTALITLRHTWHYALPRVFLRNFVFKKLEKNIIEVPCSVQEPYVAAAARRLMRESNKVLVWCKAVFRNLGALSAAGFHNCVISGGAGLLLQ